MTGRSRAQRRRAVRSCLIDRDLEALFALAAEHGDTATYVVASIFDRHDDLLRWRAIEALGHLSAYLSQVGKLESVRGIIRRLLWLMNDESGGIAWNGPEAIAEILYNTPILIDEYGRIVASFLNEEPFGPGTHWAIARMAAKSPQQFEHTTTALRRSLGSKAPEERGFALLGLSTLDPTFARNASEALVDDSGPIRLYNFATGALEHLTVADLAKRIRAAYTIAA